MLKTYGPMALKMLAQRYLPIEYGADSGGWIGDYSSVATKPSKQFIIEGGNSFAAGMPMYMPMGFDVNSISVHYLCTFICPERFSYRRP